MRVGGRLGRGIRRFLFASAAVCLVLAFVGPTADAQSTDTIPPPDVFTGNATSQAISVGLNRDALLPVPDVFKFIALDGQSAYSTSTRQARASLLFPGNGLILGPSLVCGTFGGMFPPQFKPVLDQCLQYQYPLTVFADDFSPDGQTTGNLAVGKPGDTISGNFGGARAHAGEDAATTDAALQDLKLLGLPAFGPVSLPIPGVALDTSVLTVDNGTSRTSQKIVNGVLVSTASVTLSGIHAIGGLLDIGSLTSSSKITDDGHGKRTAAATLVTTGVTVAGQPAKITSKGLELGPATQGRPFSLGAVNSLISALNIKVTALPSEESTNGTGGAVANVGGVLIEFARDVQGLPTVPGPLGDIDPNGLYTGTIEIGLTGVIGQAASFTDDLLGNTGDAGSDILGSDLGFTPTDNFGGPIDSGGTLPSGALGPTKNLSGNAGTHLVRSLADDFGDRLGLVYLALMLVVLGLCIAPRLTVPARFGPRS